MKFARLAIGTALALGLAAIPLVDFAVAASRNKPRVQAILPKATKADPCASERRDRFMCYQGNLIHCVGGKAEAGISVCSDGCDAKTNSCINTDPGDGEVGAQ